MKGRSRAMTLTRREVLRYGFTSLGLLITGPTIIGCGDDGEGRRAGGRRSNIPNLGPLGDPDANGLRLPAGFTSRVVARTGEEPIAGSGYLWHLAPDGGATFATPDGGWIYVSNSEWPFPPEMGGVGALRFDRDGNLVAAYGILSGTMTNCAGGPTPWGTWLSCEEHERGRVWECDPFGRVPGAARPALGVFQHEAAAVDPFYQQLYLTEDLPDGRLYRFTPDRLTASGHPDLSSGLLEVAEVEGTTSGTVRWHSIGDPAATSRPTRFQVPVSTRFDGGEGIWYHEGIVYFTIKGDNRVWAYDTRDSTIEVIYDDDLFTRPILRGVDNVVVSAGGDVIVAEDGDDMQLVALTPGGSVIPIVQVAGHVGSEITGPAFDPSGTRLYFSSQRGEQGIFGAPGVTFEVSGPFFV